MYTHIQNHFRSHFGSSKLHIVRYVRYTAPDFDNMSQSPLFRCLYSRKRKRKGGWRQQRNASDSDVEDAVRLVPDRVTSGLLRDWADGVLSSSALVRHMIHAKQETTTDSLTLALARNQVDQNCNSHLMDFVMSLNLVRVIREVPQPSLWTHYVSPASLLEQLSHNYPEEFARQWGG